MEIKLNLHTLVLLVGPSNSGKSYFSKNVLIPKLNTQLDEAGLNPNVHYLSSDDFRRDILGKPDAHKYDGQMMHMSKKAFNLLHTYIDNLTEFPNPAHYIVVDTTGLSKAFRDDILKQAKDHNYNTSCMIFDYKKMDEYFKHEDGSKFVTRKHMERMRKHFWKDFKKRQFNSSYKFQKQDFSDVTVTIPDIESYKKCLLPNKPIYDVIGDVHGCFNEFYDLLIRLNYNIEEGKIIKNHKDEDRKIILVGDLVDKGPDTKAVLNFVLNNLDFIHVVKGNHENFTAKWHKGLLKNISMEESFRKKHFIDTFTEDEELIELIKKIDDIGLPFVQTRNLIVTHAPALNKDLGKINKHAVRGQIKGKAGAEEIIGGTKEQYEEFYSYIKDESERSYPYHVFGHRAFKNPLKIGNKIGIDTGCVHGGRLTAVTIMGGKTFFTSVPATEDKEKEELFDLFSSPEDRYKFNMDHLTGREIGRIRWSAEDKINFISGTMSPSPASEDQIEPLSTAFDYFKNAGVEEVVLQPKYMGSRCNVYLYRDLDKCFATSRRGFNIKEERVPDLKEIFGPLQRLFKDFPDAEMILLDGELLPWDALGRGLIEDSFTTVARAVDTELDILESTGFDEKLKELLGREEYGQYKSDQVKSNKKELGEKYGQHNVSTYKNLMNFKHRTTEEHRDCLKVFKRQLEVFGQPGDIHFNPFDILKIVCENGEEKVLSAEDNYETFKTLSNNECVLVDVNNLDDVEKAYEFFNNITQDKEMEGVVVKPRFYKEGVAPFMKVRSENYLTITYGYDYKFSEKYDRLVKSKKVGRKLKTSIKEYDIGRKLLEISQKDITKENELYKSLIANMIAEEKKEETFDPRL